MKPSKLRLSLSLIVLGAALTVAGTPRPVAGQQPPADAGEQDLTRGPIHEAFAQPVVFDAQPGLTKHCLQACCDIVLTRKSRVDLAAPSLP